MHLFWDLSILLSEFRGGGGVGGRVVVWYPLEARGAGPLLGVGGGHLIAHPAVKVTFLPSSAWIPPVPPRCFLGQVQTPTFSAEVPCGKASA